MRLILFDIDGTLVLTRGAGREATQLAMTEVFGTCGALAGHKFGGKTDWQTLHELLHEAGVSHDDIERAMPAYNTAMAQHLTAIIGRYDVQPCPGAVELVESLRQRDDVGIGLVTGNVSSTAPIKLRGGGLRSCVVSGRRVWQRGAGSGSSSGARRRASRRTLSPADHAAGSDSDRRYAGGHRLRAGARCAVAVAVADRISRPQAN